MLPTATHWDDPGRQETPWGVNDSDVVPGMADQPDESAIADCDTRTTDRTRVTAARATVGLNAHRIVK